MLLTKKSLLARLTMSLRPLFHWFYHHHTWLLTYSIVKKILKRISQKAIVKKKKNSPIQYTMRRKFGLCITSPIEAVLQIFLIGLSDIVNLARNDLLVNNIFTDRRYFRRTSSTIVFLLWLDLLKDLTNGRLPCVSLGYNLSVEKTKKWY